MNASFVGQEPLSLDPSYCVYILRCSDNTFYSGCTANLEDRLSRHQRGSVTATKNRRPVEVVTYTVFNDKYKAFAFEKYLKTGSGRAFMNKRLI